MCQVFGPSSFFVVCQYELYTKIVTLQNLRQFQKIPLLFCAVYDIKKNKSEICGTVSFAR